MDKDLVRFAKIVLAQQTAVFGGVTLSGGQTLFFDGESLEEARRQIKGRKIVSVDPEKNLGEEANVLVGKKVFYQKDISLLNKLLGEFNG